MKVNLNKREPVYVQVVRHFKEQIAAGNYEPGQEIPSRRELANQLKINPNTAQRAYKEMEEQGLIFTEGNNPSRITKDGKVIGTVREELIIQAVDAFITSIRPINIPVDDLVGLIKEKYTEIERNTRGDSNDRS
ncbi:GntR family transcriptional regulator [Oceanobacillus damuensis]|uniref:GntR family transcriptional regulator n=1 Tax=Oceanobacillus damuensis TaxID=937928 RepID=UPI0008349D2E|nr:GntR family transcriptional regulator [Oceanobacillus damuensis]